MIHIEWFLHAVEAYSVGASLSIEKFNSFNAVGTSLEFKFSFQIFNWSDFLLFQYVQADWRHSRTYPAHQVNESISGEKW